MKRLREWGLLVVGLTAAYPLMRWLDEVFGTPYWILAAFPVMFLLIVVTGYTADYFRRRGGA